MIKLTEDLRATIENRLVTVFMLLDIGNAFSIGGFDILFAILASVYISPEVIELIQSYLGKWKELRLTIFTLGLWPKYKRKMYCKVKSITDKVNSAKSSVLSLLVLNCNVRLIALNYLL